MRQKIVELKQEIERARALCGKEERVYLVAATKGRSVQEIERALEWGCDAAGENRAQELLEKFSLVKNASFHFIGALQRNKVKYLVGKVSFIQSVDSVALAQEINRCFAKADSIIDILIEVNIGREAQKSGVLEEEIDELMVRVLSLKNLRLRGLMTVMPVGAPKEMYLNMRALYEQKKKDLNLAHFDILSMGMTDDYKTAITCGSNMVRIGRAIFGERK